ncbi:exopolysaccharide transport family protein [Rhizobium sp. KVB221]|uniref:Exopolysaccharide transport family protein n=1 Tax=Rhizobium setariae TaxID=2801340 RepID=A0A936YN61_9HYPH|nr:Wzz/FepE/Etk N-terminal domain-containing protein [Rhizobium setariae]MBL0371351.1 exopolysaccharide transport family protein [Rhizobium setariae]
MPVASHREQDADIDLRGLFLAIWRRRMLVLTSTVALGGLAFLGASMVSPKYQAETKILIESRSPDLSRRLTEARQPAQGVDEAGIASQVELLRSADLIKQVAKDLKLHERAEFDPSAHPSILTRIFVMLGFAKNPLDVPPEERVIKEFDQKLQVYQAEKSRVVAVQFSSKDPELAAAIPNAMAKVYLSLQSGAKLDTTSETAKWLEPEIANLREKVQAAEAKVASYRASSDLFKTSQQNTFSEQQLNDISQEITRVRGERATAEARAKSVRAALSSGRSVDTLPEVVGSQMIQRLKETQSGIEGQIADLSTQLLEGHPRLKGLRSQLEGIRSQIRTETQKILASLENEAGVSRMREQQLMQQLSTLKADTASTQEKEVGLNALEREAVAQRQLLETYLARYREAVSQQDMNATPADARIVSRATMPSEPYFPKILPITIVSALAGVILSAVFVMLAELFSGRALRPVNYEQDEPEGGDHVEMERQEVRQSVVVSAQPDARPVGAHQKGIAPSAISPSLLSFAAPEMEAAETDLQDGDEEDVEGEFSPNSVARHLVGADVNVAIVVSLVGDGGSAATVVLARTAAEMGRKTILIDMTGSALPTRMMADSVSLPGITDLLTGEAAFAETIHGDRASDAHILPHGTANAKRAMRGADRLSMVIDALAEAYDLVIVECGPADVAGVGRLARKGQAEIILSASPAAAEKIEEVAGGFIDAGYEDVVLLFGRQDVSPTDSSRQAA